jgi:ribosome biogenesis GTPase
MPPWSQNSGPEEEEWAEGLKLPARRKYAKRIVKGRAVELEAAAGNGVVAEIFPNQAAVRLDTCGTGSSAGAGRTDSLTAGGARKLCGYRMSALAFGGNVRERSPVCVGDRVLVAGDVIVGRCARRNRLIRSAPNSRDPLLHVIAANIDCLVVVSAALEPEFSPGIVDRFLVAASSQAIAPLLCVNKTDLLSPGPPKAWAHYPEAGVPVVECSARSGSGAEALAALLRGKTVAFCGHSGVGKTSLLRRLLGDEALGRVGELSGATGMGRHTTTGAVMLPGAGGSAWIDTPGIMNFSLVGVERSALLSHFPELARAAAACAEGCLHDAEPACALRALPRFPSYRQIRASL